MFTLAREITETVKSNFVPFSVGVYHKEKKQLGRKIL